MIIFVDAGMLKKMLGIVFLLTFNCIRHRISSNYVDLNICAHTWHSVSVMGHKKSFELAVHALARQNMFYIILYTDWKLLNYKRLSE